MSERQPCKHCGFVGEHSVGCPIGAKLKLEFCPRCGGTEQHAPTCPISGGLHSPTCKAASGSSPLDTQVGGAHYKDMTIQPITFVHANRLPFIEGAVIKYVCRHRQKNGAEDLKKAIHYLQLLLELEYGKKCKP